MHALLFGALFAVAWVTEHHVLAILAVPFFVAMVIAAYSPAPFGAWTLLVIGVAPYLFVSTSPCCSGSFPWPGSSSSGS